MPVPLNEHLAQWAQRGAQIGNCGKLCEGCAFKLNTVANRDEEAVEDAAQCLAYEGTFNCHIKSSPDEPDKPCRGFLYAQLYFKNLFKGKISPVERIKI